MNMHKSYRVQELAEKLYAELSAQGIEVLMDDRKERPGVMFADMELIGIPHTIVLGDRTSTTMISNTSIVATVRSS